MPDDGCMVVLSDRELEILELAGMSFSLKTIARVLQISSGTVKWHLQNVYSKLDRSTREAALARARALGMIHPVLQLVGDHAPPPALERRHRILSRRLAQAAIGA